jgi:hypothetical protein
MPPRYFIRAVKSAVSFFVIASLAIVLVYFLSDGQEKVPFNEYLQKGNNITWMAVFLGAFGFVYPLIGYAQNKSPLARVLSDDDKAVIVAVFVNARYVLANDDGHTLVFRHQSALTRLMRLYEDAITVDYSGNLLLTEGLRRDADRLARTVAWKLREKEDEER